MGEAGHVLGTLGGGSWSCSRNSVEAAGHVLGTLGGGSWSWVGAAGHVLYSPSSLPIYPLTQ